MRALRLAAGSEISQPSLSDITEDLSSEEAEQDAVNRMRADMAAIKAELNRRVDAAEQITPQRENLCRWLKNQSVPSWKLQSPQHDLNPSR